MRNIFYITLSAGVVISTLAIGNLAVRLDKAALTAQQMYAKGYEDGKKANIISIPKACVTWWFGEETKVRHKQAVEAYCKGSK